MEYQRRDIQVIQQYVAEPGDGAMALSLGEEILRSEREHLEMLKSFRPPRACLRNPDTRPAGREANNIIERMIDCTQCGYRKGYGHENA